MAGIAAMGLAIGAVGGIIGGIQAKQAADAEAVQMESMATEARAVGQYNALEKRREQELVESAALAQAASQGGASDPSVLDIFGDIAEQGERNFAMETFKGETQARGLEFGAEMKKFEGKQALIAGFTGAGGTLASGGSNLYQQFGQIGSQATSSGYAYG